jgi:hypothetical protein
MLNTINQKKMKKLYIAFTVLHFVSFSLYAQTPGNALSFDGQDDYVQLPAAVYFNGQYSIECWVYPRSYGHYTRIIDFGNGESSDNIILVLSSAATNNPFLSVYPGNYNLTASKPLELNKWSHIAVTVGADKAKVYINGSIVAIDEASNHLASNVVRDNCYIARSNWTIDDYSDVMLDELRIWNTARTQQQIVDNMHQSLSGSEFGLEAYYIFNHSTGTTLMDVSDEPYYDGTLYNMDNNDWVVSNAMIQPIIKPATNINDTSFTVNWHTIDGANMYLDVSTKVNFDTLDILDNQNLGVVNTSDIAGLDTATTYFYRLKSEANVLSDYSETGMATTKGRPSGKCIHFDGVDDYVDLGDFTLPENYSIEFWAKADNPNKAGGDYIIGKHSYNSSNQFLIGYANSEMQIYNGTNSIYINNHFQTTGWYHFAAVFQEKTNNTTEIKVYKNGNLIKDAVLNSVTGDLTGKDWVLAQEWDATPSDFYKGKLDEVRFWGKALTQADIKSNMYHELSGAESDLIAYYDFNSIHGQFTPDVTGNGYHGHIIGMDNIPSQWVEADAMITPTAREPYLLSDTSFTARWYPIPNATKYYIEVSDTNDFSDIIINDSTITDTSYLVTGLTPGNNYYYRIKSHAYNKTVNSNVVEVFTKMVPPGNAMFSDGDDYIETNVELKLSNTSFTFEFWSNRTTLNLNQVIFAHAQTENNACLHAGYRVGNGFFVDFYENQILVEDQIDKNEWVHWAFSYDNATRQRKIYRNGVLAASDTSSSDYYGNGSIKMFSYASLGNYFRGKLDEFRIWDHARSTEQINANLHKTLNGDEAGLQLYYDFDVSQGNRIMNLAANGGETGEIHQGEGNEWVESFAVTIPFAREATNISHTDFTANWDSVPSAEKYYLQVAADADFSNIVVFDSTINNAYDVSLSPYSGASFYYRVWCKTVKLSDTSNVMPVFFPPGNAVVMENTFDAIVTPHHDSINFGDGPFTIELWFKNNNTGASSHKRLVTKRGAAEMWYSFLFYNNKLGIELSNNSKTRLTVGVGPDINGDGLWHHAAVVRNDTGAVYIYLDGIPYYAGDFPYTIDNTEMLEFGKWTTEAQGGETFYGKMDEIRMWNVARTQQEINQYRHQELTGDEDGLMLYYNLDQYQGTIVYDQSKNKIDGDFNQLDASAWIPSRALITPVAREAANVTMGSFNANWDSVDLAQKYYIQVSDKEDFSNLIINDSTINAHYEVTGLKGNNYYYRVMALANRLSDTSNVIDVYFTPGNALAFDGVNDYAADDTYYNQLNTPQFSYTAWAKVTGNDNKYRAVFSSRGIEPFKGVTLYASASNKWQLLIGDDSQWYSIFSPDIIVNDQWYYIACTYDGMTLKLFVNGDLVAQTQVSNYVVNPDQPFSIGKVSESNNYYFNGLIDEITVWDRPLTEQEVNEIMHQQVSVDENGLLAYYNFDETNAAKIYDRTWTPFFFDLPLHNMDPATDWVESHALITPFAREATQLTTNGFVANWDSIPNAVEYTLEISDKENFSNIIVNETMDSNSYHLTGIDEGTVLYYRVKAKTDKESDYSNTVRVNVPMAVPGNALSFNGTNQRIDAYNVSTANFRRGLTLEAWIKTPDNTRHTKFLGFFRSGGGNRNLLNITSNKKLTYWDDTKGYLNSPNPDDTLANNTWYHVAMVIEPNNNCYVYQNGEIMVSFTTSVLPLTDGRFTIGCDWDGGSTNDYFSGMMDELRVWDYPRSREQLQNNMHNPIAPDENGLVAYYHFDNHSGNTLYDLTSNKYHGSMINMNDNNWQPSMAIIQPSAREATGVTYSSFVANWDTVPNVSDYILDITTDRTFDTLDIIDSVVLNQTHYLADTLKQSTDYFYRIRYFKDTLSAYSNVIKVATAARKPKIINDSITDICDYDTLILQSNYMINNEYQWFLNDTAIPGADKDHYFVDTSGTYKFMAIDTLWQDTAWSNPATITIHTSRFGTGFAASDSILNSPNFESYKFRVNFTNNTPHMSQYQYNWDFGDDSTTHDTDPVHSYLFNGKYTVALTVTDTTTMCMQKLEKPEYIVCKGGIDNIDNGIIVGGQTSICPDDSVKLACREKNADVYQWRKGGANITNANDSTLHATEAGTYSCMLTIAGITTEETEQINIDTFNLIEPVIVSDAILDACMTDSVTLSLDTTYHQYSWSTGDSIMQIIVKQPDDYRVTVVDNNGCQLVSDTYKLDYSYIPVPQICMVTVDTSDNSNLVVWDKLSDGRVAGYRIYKEQNADNNFVLMDSVMQNELTVWVDTASDPRANAERYKISAFDTCGNETVMSNYHKTIHLQINAGTQGERNLLWDDYEIGDYNLSNNRVINSVAFGEGSYFVFRGTSPNDMQLYATRPAGTKTWSDFDTSQVYYYRVAAIKADTCDPAGLLKASGGPYSKSVSNLEDNRLKGDNIENINNNLSLQIYPNPFKNTANIIYTLNTPSFIVLEIYNTLGEIVDKTVNHKQKTGKYSYTFDPKEHNCPEGMYYLKIYIDNDHIMRKLIYHQ